MSYKKNLICPYCGGTFIVQVEVVHEGAMIRARNFRNKDGSYILEGSRIECNSCTAKASIGDLREMMRK